MFNVSQRTLKHVIQTKIESKAPTAAITGEQKAKITDRNLNTAQCIIAGVYLQRWAYPDTMWMKNVEQLRV